MPKEATESKWNGGDADNSEDQNVGGHVFPSIWACSWARVPAPSMTGSSAMQAA